MDTYQWDLTVEPEPDASSRRWLIWVPPVAAVGCAIPAGVCAYFFSVLLAMMGAPPVVAITVPLGAAAVAGSIGVLATRAAGAPVGYGCAPLFGFSMGWLGSAAILFCVGYRPLIDPTPVWALPLGWGVVGASLGISIALGRKGGVSAPSGCALACRGVSMIVCLVLVGFMAYQSYRVVFYAVPQLGQKTASLQIAGEITSLEFSPHETLLVVGSRRENSGIVHLFDTSTWQVHELHQDQPVIDVALSPKQSTLAIACNGEASGKVRLWDISASKVVREIETSERIVNVDYSPDGRYLSVLSSDKSAQTTTLTVWDTDSWAECLRRTIAGGVLTRYGSPLWETTPIAGSWAIERDAVAFTADSRSIAILKADTTRRSSSTLDVWEIETKANQTTSIQTYAGHSVSFLPDGTILLVGAEASRKYDPATKELGDAPWAVLAPPATKLSLRSMFGKPGLPEYGCQLSCWCLPSNKKTLVTAGARVAPTDSRSMYPNAMIWDVETGALLAEGFFGDVEARVDAVAISPDGRTLAVAPVNRSRDSGTGGRIEVFDVGPTTDEARRRAASLNR